MALAAFILIFALKNHNPTLNMLNVTGQIADILSILRGDEMQLGTVCLKHESSIDKLTGFWTIMEEGDSDRPTLKKRIKDNVFVEISMEWANKALDKVLNQMSKIICSNRRLKNSVCERKCRAKTVLSVNNWDIVLWAYASISSPSPMQNISKSQIEESLRFFLSENIMWNQWMPHSATYSATFHLSMVWHPVFSSNK